MQVLFAECKPGLMILINFEEFEFIIDRIYDLTIDREREREKKNKN